jgi:hypothetical protein
MWPLQSLYDDLRFPAQGINPPGPIGAPDRDPDDGTLLFDSSTEELVAGVAQMPHTWEEGSIIEPHVHWCKTTSAAGGVVWQLEYAWANVGSVIPAFSAVIPGTTVVSNGDTANLHAITTFGEISGLGKKISSILLWRVRRAPTDGGDTYGADAKLLEFDIHYRIDAFGSAQRYIKNQA